MDRILNYVYGLKSPVCLFSASGEILMTNPAMDHILSSLKSGGQKKRDFTDTPGESTCHDCLKASSAKGRCLIPRELPGAPLLAAVSVSGEPGAILAVYCAGDSRKEERNDLVPVIGSLFTGESSVFASRRPDGAVSLRETIEKAARAAGAFEAGIHFKTFGARYLTPLSAVIMQSTLARTFREISLFSTLSAMTRIADTSGDEQGQEVFPLTIISPLAEQFGARTLIAVNAANLRLKRYFDALCATTSVPSSTPPVITIEEAMVNAEFSLQTGLEPGEAPHLPDYYKKLTSREAEIAERVASGQDDALIATNTGIEKSTVKQHLKAIFRKTGYKNKVELILGMREER
ncbi:MAG: helix-turn-helix transcriptional regulator [Nitrospinae bacterium]|nr:helix-turn-helix transcriptional regulator [Nitrospinota bacterium]